MPVLVKLARTAGDIDQVFRLRHDVYVDEGGYMESTPHARIYDRFDALPGTLLLMAEIDGRAVGTVRFTTDRGAGTHADDFYDFRPHLPAGARVGSGSMLAVRAGWRRTPRLATSLIGMCIYHASRAGLTHLLGTVNPEVLDGFLELGFRPVDGVLTHEGLPFVPVVLRLADLGGRIAAFVDRQSPWSAVSERDRLFLSPGERLPRLPEGQGYVVTRGQIQTIGADGRCRIRSAGDVIGFDEPATALAVASTKVDLLIISIEADAELLAAGCSSDYASVVKDPLERRTDAAA